MVRPLRTLLRIFATGALAALPLAATVLIFAWAAGILIRWLGPGSAVGRLLVSIGLGVGASEVVGYAIGVAIVAFLIFGLGLIVEAGLQRGFASVVNGVLLRQELGIPTDHPRRYMDPLTEAGIVVEFTDKSRNRAWRAPQVLAALDDFAERAGRRN